MILGFPCNQFGAQEPGSNEEILDFVKDTYDVNFPMFSKIDVNGADAAPVYEFLKSGAPNGDGSTDIKWNFEKFVVDEEGNVVRRFGTKVTPEEIATQI